MASWNNRLFEQEDGSLRVHEVFYDRVENGEVTITGWVETSELTDSFDDMDGMIRHVETILKDLKRAKKGLLPIVKFEEWQRLLREAEEKRG